MSPLQSLVTGAIMMTKVRVVSSLGALALTKAVAIQHMGHSYFVLAAYYEDYVMYSHSWCDADGMASFSVDKPISFEF